MLIAIAGHVDHGKTSLLQCLTGVNTDSLPEEKKRGMTIDIGFAYESYEGRTVGFIDVPGHERFLSNMLAGVAGVDLALLVVACDDSVMPQTREHLAILQLLGVTRVVVALSKSDLVDASRVVAVSKQVREIVPCDSPIIAVSSLSGQGVAQLKALLLAEQETSHHALKQKFRLAIDRVFTLAGVGLVVTGTAFSGTVNVGDRLWLCVGNAPVSVRVRSLHVMNQPADEGRAGQRMALNLVGEVSKQEIHRGHWLLAMESGHRPEPTNSVDVLLHVLDTPVRHWQSVHIHAAALHITGRISLLEKSLCEKGMALARLHLDSPVYCVAGDRFVLRDASAQTSLAGARVIDTFPPGRGQRRPERLALLEQLSHSDCQQALLLLAKQGVGVSLPCFARCYNLPLAQAVTLACALNLTCVRGSVAYLPHNWEELCIRVLDKLALAHEAMPDQAGVSSERLHRLAVPSLAGEIFIALRDGLLQSGRLAQNGSWLHLPSFLLKFNDTEEALWQRLCPYFQEPFIPLWVRDLGLAESIDEKVVRDLLKKAARLGEVVAIVPDRYLLMKSVCQLANIVRELAQNNPIITVGSFRDRIGGGRKLAVQILEFFDRSGLTRRAKSDHILRDESLFLV